MHYLLFYDYSPDYLERRGQVRGEHLKLAWAAAERGELVLGGVLAALVHTGVLLFAGRSRALCGRRSLHGQRAGRQLSRAALGYGCGRVGGQPGAMTSPQ